MHSSTRFMLFAIGAAWLSLAGCGGGGDDDVSPAGNGGSSGAAGSHAGSGATGGSISGGQAGQLGGEAGQVTEPAGGEAGEVSAGAGNLGGAGETAVGGNGATNVGGSSVGGTGAAGRGGSSAGGAGTTSVGGSSSGSGGSSGDVCAGVACSGHGSCTVVEAAPSCVCNSGYGQPSGVPTECVDIDECASNHGGCDPRVSCTNVPGAHVCGDCPAGYGGTGDTTCTPTTCFDAPDQSCACIKVSLDGDDTLAAVSGGILPFANVAPAIDFAASYPNAPRVVCVAEGTTCGMKATYAGPNGADLAMRNGISVYGHYESTAWARCEDRGTTLAPGTGNGVYFGPTIASRTVLDGFTIARFSAPSTAGVTVDGAHAAIVAHVDVGTPVTGATDAYGIDAKNGADTLLALITMHADPTWTAPNEVGIHAVSAKVEVVGSQIAMYSAAASEHQTLLGALLENADGSQVIDTAFAFYGPMPLGTGVVGVHAANTNGLRLDGTALTFNGYTQLSTAADFTNVSGLSWQSGSIIGNQADIGLAISLVDSPGAKLGVGVSTDYNLATGIYLTGNAEGTLLSGSVSSPMPGVNAGVMLDDCAGSAPLVRTSVNVPTRGNRDGILVRGSCYPTISANANVSVYIPTIPTPSTQRQTLAAIRCRAPSECTIDHSVATITGGETPYASLIDAYGIACDWGACPTIVDSTASGLSAVGEHRDAAYTGAGILAPGATLVARNTARGLCSGRDGAGMRTEGRIENNVIVGPTCGATYIDALEKAIGLQLTGTSVVHSNSIKGGGATDWYSGSSGQGCRAAGVVDFGYGQYFNNIVEGGCGTNVALFGSSGWFGNATFGTLSHNDLIGSSLVAYGEVSPSNPGNALIPKERLTTATEVNALAAASGNFSGGSVVDAGTTLQAPLTDIDGVPRDASPDVGPWEATGEPTACLGVTCSNHGVCRVDQGAACVCDPGYSGADCATVDPCTTKNGGCDPLTTCSFDGTTTSCGPCPSGYTGSGATGCVDVDECQTDNGDCDPLTTCTNVPGGRTCGPCPPAYVGTGETGCVLGTHCTPNPCSHDGICVEGDPTYSCDCLPGNGGPSCELTATAVSLGYNEICTLLTDQSLDCSGYRLGMQTPPAGSFISLTSTSFFDCVVALDGEAICWGENAPTPPPDVFQAIAAANSGSHVCGLHPDGTVACWGSNFWGQANPPSDTFTAVAAGGPHTCGIRTDGSLFCWGDSAWGMTTPPAGFFKGLAVGGAHACAIAPDDSVVCWGNNDYGQLNSPAGAFRELSAAEYYTCGIRTDGSISCWGDDNDGKLVPPAGTGYHSLATHSYQSMPLIARACAVDAEGKLACWGDPLK